MTNIFLHGKPAVKVHAKVVLWGNTSTSQLYNIDGDKRWIPNKLCAYNDEEKTLIIEDWFYHKLFENESR